MNNVDYSVHVVLTEKIGPSIRVRRLEKGLAQAELARAAGVSRTTLSRLEQGKGTPIQTDVLDRILTALGITADISFGTPVDPERILARMRQREKLLLQRERHLRLAVELAAEPARAREKMVRARAVVALWRKNRTCSRLYIDRWSRLLSLAPARLAKRMVSLGEWEDAMFQNTPWSWSWN